MPRKPPSTRLARVAIILFTFCIASIGLASPLDSP